VLPSEPLLARCRHTEPGLAPGGRQHGDVAETVPKPGADCLEELRRTPQHVTRAHFGVPVHEHGLLPRGFSPIVTGPPVQQSPPAALLA